MYIITHIQLKMDYDQLHVPLEECSVVKLQEPHACIYGLLKSGSSF